MGVEINEDNFGEELNSKGFLFANQLVAGAPAQIMTSKFLFLISFIFFELNNDLK